MLSKYSLPGVVFRDGNRGASLSPDLIERQVPGTATAYSLSQVNRQLSAGKTVCVPGLDGGTVSHHAQDRNPAHRLA